MVNKKIVVLGGFGFLGKHVVEELEKEKFTPIILSLFMVVMMPIISFPYSSKFSNNISLNSTRA